jgi:hypothetical protein
MKDFYLKARNWAVNHKPISIGVGVIIIILIASRFL